MRLFLDTASIDEVRHAVNMGILAGVTTNPTLMAKERGVPYRERVVEICEAVQGPVSAECVARELRELLEEAREGAAWHKHDVVKIPTDELGVEGREGREVVREAVDIFDRYHLPSQVLAASIRHPRHVVEAARAGASISTVPFAGLQAMGRPPRTAAGH